MPVVKKRTFKGSTSPQSSSSPNNLSSPSGEGFKLPTKPKKASDDLSRYAFILYGERGIGKSTLASMLGKMFFLMFETDRTLEVLAEDINDWKSFSAYVDLFLKGGHDFSGIVVDNGAMSYDCALEYACKRAGIEHPGGQNDYGASWNKVKKAFTTPFRKLLASRYGLVVICHEMEKEITTRGGGTFVKMRPDYSNQADQFLGAFIENIFYYYYDNNERWLQIIGDEYITAKVKFERHFFTPKGERIHRIPMGNSMDEAYKNLMAAFNNKQKESYAEMRKEDKKTVSFKRG